MTDNTEYDLHGYEPGHDDTPLVLLEKAGGFYECPRDADGKRIGPLVGYAGKYGSDELQYVGDVYANFGKLERWPHLVESIVDTTDLIALYEYPIDVICGVPEGGRTLGQEVARQLRSAFVYPVKSIVKPATETHRQEEALVFSREEPWAGHRVWISEDVVNNMTNTEETIAGIEAFGATVEGICCFLNRSETNDHEYTTRSGRTIPIVYAVRKTYSQWQQDDPAVALDMQSGNFALKPKKEWSRLMSAMNAAR
ncbi:MAG: hypothetical protein KBC38_00265 [Candidatus Pacebacteria bacterium]|nr:hypothetical protein [Candidatus Paceibacterota bacterium]MBP9840432.1 hypothetical protein [Candidatus Paceibacterota bacterium]